MKTLAGYVLGAGVLCAAVLALAQAMDLPEVHVSHTTGKCVRIVDANGERSCSSGALPDRYDHVWVK